MTPENYETDVVYLNALVNLLKEENKSLRMQIQNEWFISLDFYIMSNRLILNTIDEYKIYRYPHIIQGLKDRLKYLQNKNVDINSPTSRLKLNLMDTITQAIEQCENYKNHE